MKKYFIVTGLFFVLLIMFSSCQNSKTEDYKPAQDTIKTQAPDYAVIKNIVEEKYLKRADKVIYQEFNNEKFIAAVHLDPPMSTIFVLKEFAGTWQETTNIDCIDFVDMSFATINSCPYLYYCYTSNGNVIGSVNFVLLNLNNKKEYSIAFEGPVGKYESLEDIPGELKNQPDILNFLKNKAAASPLVVKTSLTDDGSRETNYRKDWQIANEHIYKQMSYNYDIWYDLTAKQYDINILGNLDEGSIAAKAESNKYSITSVFKGNVIAYNKKSGKYIPIWLPEDLYQWIDGLKMKNSGTVILSKNNEELYEINIDKMKIHSLTKKEVF